MEHIGNIRKMKGQLTNGKVSYQLPLYNVLEASEMVDMNVLVGKTIRLQFENEIHCVVSGKKIKKAYGEGMSYDAFIKSPLAVESIIRPELSRIHEGIALRDKEWEEKHHLQPHAVYLSLTAGVKVGVTRSTNIPSRWIDQGANEALVFANTPYRQAAGLIEVYLKKFFADKTNWRKMLTNDIDAIDLYEQRAKIKSLLPDEFIPYFDEKEQNCQIAYPVISFPSKVKSLKLDKLPVIEGKLNGIKGQYLIFDGGEVINIRSHTAYKIKLSY